MNKQIYKDCFRWMIKAIILNIFIEVVVGFLSIVIANYLGRITDAILEWDFSLFASNVGKITVCLVINIIVIPCINIFFDAVCIKAGTQSDSEMCVKIAKWKYETFSKISEGDMAYRIQDELNEFRLTYLNFVSNIFIIPIIFGYWLFNMKNVGLLYTLLIIFISILKIVMPIMLKSKNEKYEKENRRYGSELKQNLYDIASKSVFIKKLGIENNYIKILDTCFINHLKIKIKEIFTKSFQETMVEVNNNLSTIIIIGFGAYLVANEQLSVGNIVIMIAYLGIIDDVLNRLSEMVNNYPGLRIMGERLAFFYDSVEELVHDEKNNKYMVSDILFKNVSFCHDGGVVLKDISFKIKKGDKVCVCGNNGSGKTTLLNLLCGFITDYTGEIIVNGIELRKLNMFRWRNSVSVVLQEPFIFPDTLLDNFVIAAPKKNINEIDEYIKKEKMFKWEEKKYISNTANVSGGEKKKIAILQAVFRNNDVLILDEPTNDLDEISKRKLIDFLRKTSKTVICITHDKDVERLFETCIEL